MAYRVAVGFALGGDLRFLSHQDSMKLFERAALRAGLPLRWSEGFNPRPRLWLPLPRPVGIASDDDLLVVELEADSPEQALAPDRVRERLGDELPPQIRLTDARQVPRAPQPTRATYHLDLPDEHATGDLPARVRGLLDAESCVVQRRIDADGNTRPVDIRPYVLELAAGQDGASLTMTLGVTPSGSARASDVLMALGLNVEELAHRVVRRRVAWRFEQTGPETGNTGKEL